VKAITIHPVWAWAIVHGFKPVENRTWKTKHRGPLLIHASADSPAARKSDAVARAALGALGIAVPEDVPRAAIVGHVELVDCVGRAEDGGEVIPGPPSLAVGPVCWVLTNPVALAQPTPCRGRQKLFEVA
jgi:hypothetical protein